MDAAPNHINTAPETPKTNMPNIFLNFNPAYQAIISHTNPKIKIVPKSGINKKTKNKIAFRIIKDIINSFLFT